ncbi:hypothetical protein OC844_004980 [Tilletia horrida]|nr:hypothetical protein OC844_004980 [Tilletia horrida]
MSKRGASTQLSRKLKKPTVKKGNVSASTGGTASFTEQPSTPLDVVTLGAAAFLPAPPRPGLKASRRDKTASSWSDRMDLDMQDQDNDNEDDDEPYETKYGFYHDHMLPDPPPTGFAQAPAEIDHREEEQREFDDWARFLDHLVEPFMEAVNGLLPPHQSWASLACFCARGEDATVQVDFLDVNAYHRHVVKACPLHIAQTLVRAGAVPSTVIRPKAAFSFHLVRYFLSLQEHSRVGAYNFTIATYQTLRMGTTDILPNFVWMSRDCGRRPLRSATEWYQALARRAIDTVQAHFPLPPYERPAIEEDDYTLTLSDLADRCPACFGGLFAHERGAAENEQDEASMDDAPQVIVCLDGNFQQKRERKKDAVRTGTRSPSFILSPNQLEAARLRFELEGIGEGPRTGCSSEVRAAVDGTVKTSKVDFDIGGVVGMTCRHGSPLLLVNVRDSGESHYYGWALIEALLDACGTGLRSLGICYDIGCKLAVSPRLKAAMEARAHEVELVHVVSLFHVYGHDYGCQMKYSPRRTPGFGLTDGESLERLWSSLADLVSLTRKMTEADRNSALTSRLESLARDHRLHLMDTIHGRILKIVNTRQARTKELMGSLKHVLSYTGEQAKDALAQCCPTTGLPRQASDYLVKQIKERRRIALNRADHMAKLAQRRKTDAKNRIINISTDAQLLRVPLQSWHSLAAMIKQRPNHGDQQGTAKLTISKAGSAREAHSHLASFNKAVESYRGKLPASVAERFRPVRKEDLFKMSTLTYVRGLLSHVDYEEEPWALDGQLSVLMDTMEVLLRLGEEETRLVLELRNMRSWFSVVDAALQSRHADLSNPRSGPGSGQSGLSGGKGQTLTSDRDYRRNGDLDSEHRPTSATQRNVYPQPGVVLQRDVAPPAPQHDATLPVPRLGAVPQRPEGRTALVSRLLGEHRSEFEVWKARIGDSLRWQELYLDTLRTQKAATVAADRLKRMDHLIERQTKLLDAVRDWHTFEPSALPSTLPDSFCLHDLLPSTYPDSYRLHEFPSEAARLDKDVAPVMLEVDPAEIDPDDETSPDAVADVLRRHCSLNRYDD